MLAVIILVILVVVAVLVFILSGGRGTMLAVRNSYATATLALMSRRFPLAGLQF